AGTGGVATLCIRSCSCAILHCCSADAHPHPPPLPEKTRRRPLSSGSGSPPQDTLADETFPRDGKRDHPYHSSTNRSGRPFPRTTPLHSDTNLPLEGHGLAAGRQRRRGDGFVESALPSR
ncbi:unnamed protein product, partial [Laminaria digitata]